MKKRTVKLFLEDINEFILLIEKYIEGLDYKKFSKNQMVIDAVLRNLELIGEASKKIPEEIQNKYPQIPWKKMYGLRNLIAHEYFGIDEIFYSIRHCLRFFQLSNFLLIVSFVLFKICFHSIECFIYHFFGNTE